MSTKTLVSIISSVLALCLLGAGQPQPASFDGAHWIWSWPDPGAPSPVPPAGAVYFRTTITLPDGAQVKSAEAFITADNLFTFYLNGKPAGQSTSNPNDWKTPKRFDVAGLLAPGRNVVAVEAVNTVEGPAGLLAKLIVTLAGGRQVVSETDDTWKCSEKDAPNWPAPAFDDKSWQAAHTVGEYGSAPWGRFARDLAATPAEKPPDPGKPLAKWGKAVAGQPRAAAAPPSRLTEITPPADYPWPAAVIFLGDDCSLYREGRPLTGPHSTLSVTIFNARKSRAFPEHDLPAPIKIGRKLYALSPARPGTKPRLLLDAGKGAIGSPSVSFDGRTIYVSMAKDGEPFFHIYRLPAEGGEAQRLTDGPFHDIDPAEMPDGRIAFTSTRIGMYDEYHNPPARALFAMDADGKNIRPITNTFIFDNEPEIMPDGRILFIRSDNFFDRGKVETLLHAVHPDGTEGYTEFGLDNGPDYGGRLRAYYCGSPAPMPDGRVAFVSSPGVTIGWPGTEAKYQKNYQMEAGDVAAMPDNRLLVTVARRAALENAPGKQKRPAADLQYEKIAILDPADAENRLVVLYDSAGEAIHSPVFLGPRQRPPLLAKKVLAQSQDQARPTGFFFCQNARFTKNTTAGWSHVRAIRVLAGKGLTNRSSHSYIVHAGSEVVELGTIPLPPDGSFFVEVPADVGIAFQAVDAEGRSELNEMSWIYVRPGETRGCLGCHQTRQASAPCAASVAQALQAPALKLLGKGDPHRFRGNNAAVTGEMEMQFDRYRELDGLNRHSETADPLATGAQEVAALAASLTGVPELPGKGGMPTPPLRGHASGAGESMPSKQRAGHATPDDGALPGSSGIPGLNGGEEGAKMSAAQRLAIFRDPAAAPALAERLKDESREVRVAAAIALATCGTRDSVPPLLAALADADPLVAQAAAIAVENLSGHAEPFNPFVAAGERTQQAEKWQAWLRGTNWEAIEKDLIKRLENPDRDVVRRAAVALAHTGAGDAARAAVRAYVARERQNNPYPEWKKAGHNGDGTRFNSLSPANPRTLQAATRTLGYLKDKESVPMLAETVAQNSAPATANLFLAEAAVEALGRIGTPEAEDALVKSMAGLKDYFYFVGWYGDHSALYACHASPVHYLIAEALDAMGSKRAAPILPNLIRSMPTDPDRALMLQTDDCEALVGRIIRRSGAEASVVETCLAILGDPDAKKTPEIADAIAKTYAAWAGKPDPENRAAQVLSAVCRDKTFEPRIRAALDRYRALPPSDIPRVMNTALPRVLPVKNWVCFFL
ncbi:MAG: HEAT repeat domain-containing protein, partial [Planctomycetota bacterium]|nr:HEAT repeat domain-containing protein [Planctomycetota bacterium]